MFPSLSVYFCKSVKSPSVSRHFLEKHLFWTNPVGHISVSNFLLTDAESNICKYNVMIINNITLFWRGKSYVEGRLRDRKLARICKWSCRQKKKKQTSENMAMRFFANSHLLTRIFAHSCIRCEASAFVLQSLSLQIAFSCSFLFSSLQMFIL